MKIALDAHEHLDTTVEGVGRFYDAKIQQHGLGWAYTPVEVLEMYLRWAIPGEIILDAGCGAGYLLERWQARK